MLDSVWQRTGDDVMLDSLWQGLDVMSDEALNLAFSGTPQTTNFARHGLPRTDIQFLGMFDAGNHLMMQVASKTFANLNAVSVWTGNGIWTHTPFSKQVKDLLIANVHDKRMNMSIENTNVVVMVRSPFSVITSWIKAPYELDKCSSKGLDQQCSMGCGGIPPSWIRFYTWHLDCPYHFQGLIGAYNTFLRGYFEELPKIGFKSVTIVPYEKLVLDTDNECRRVAKTAGLKFQNEAMQVVLPEEPAKLHGDPKFRTAAISRIRLKRYLFDLERANLQMICRELDPEVLKYVPDYKAEFDMVCSKV